MLTSGTLPKVRHFASKLSDPDGSYWGMKTYLKTRIRLQQKIISRNFLTKLHKKRVGTGEIENAARRNVFGSNINVVRNKMVEKEVLRILKMRILVADKKIKEYKHELKVATDEKDAMFHEESWKWKILPAGWRIVSKISSRVHC